MIPPFDQASGSDRDDQKALEELERVLENLNFEEAITAADLRHQSFKKKFEQAMASHKHRQAGDHGRPAANEPGACGGSTIENKKSETSERRKSESPDLDDIKVPGNIRSSRGRRRRLSAAATSDPLVTCPWSRQIDEVRILIHQLALDAAGQSLQFTVRFNDAVIADASDVKKTFSTWANDRLSYYLEPLEQQLGRELPFWFSVETSRAGHLHLHGAIGIEEEHLGNLRQALQRFSGGAFKGAGRWFVDVEPFDDNKTWDGLEGSLGWARYASKRFRRKPKEPRLGSQLVCRRSLNRRSRLIWEEMQEENLRDDAA